MHANPEILIVLGSTTPGGRLGVLADEVEIACQAGAKVSRCNLAQTKLPLMCPDEPGQSELAEVRAVRAQAAAADGFVLITPEYHGNLSGALKNWFDFLYLELAGKLAGVISATGGGGGDMSIVAVKNSFSWCHGFTLPFHAAAKPADFTDGVLTSAKLRDRIHRIGYDVVRYAPVIRAAFETAREGGGAVENGVAGLHARG